MKQWLRNNIFLLVTSCFLIITLTGCGYTTRSLLSTEFRTIYIKPFINKVDITSEVFTGDKYKIYRPGLETDITRYVNDKFLFDGNLKPVKNESADLILEGELVDFRKDPLRYSDDNNTVTEYRVNLVVNLTLKNRKEDKVSWQESNFTGYTTYFTTGSLAKSESQAITDAMIDLGRRVVERTVEQW